MTDRIALRERLVEMRERLIEEIVDGIDGGGLARLNEIHGTIAALDAEAIGRPLMRVSAGGCDDAADRVAPHSAPPLRTVVRDEPGRAVELQMYDNRGLVAAVPVSAHRALALASDLIAAARARLVE